MPYGKAAVWKWLPRKLRSRIVVRQYFPIADAGFGHDICAVLAHANTMPVAADGEQEILPCTIQRKGRGAQGKHVSQLTSGH